MKLDRKAHALLPQGAVNKHQRDWLPIYRNHGSGQTGRFDTSMSMATLCFSKPRYYRNPGPSCKKNLALYSPFDSRKQLGIVSGVVSGPRVPPSPCPLTPPVVAWDNISRAGGDGIRSPT